MWSGAGRLGSRGSQRSGVSTMFNALYESVTTAGEAVAGVTGATAHALLSPTGLVDTLPSTTPELEDEETKARQAIENAHDDLPAWGPLEPPKEGEEPRKPFTLRIGQGDISDLNFQMTTAEMKVMYEHSKRDAAARRARPLLIRMYGEDWLTQTRQIEALVRRGFEMDDKDIEQLSEALCNGWFPLLKHLWLDENTFTDEGLYALIRAIEHPKCVLEYVSIEGCDEVSDEAELALKKALNGNVRPVEAWESKVEERRAEHAAKQAEEEKEKERQAQERAQMLAGTRQIAG